jgi:hypothetical protein
MKNIKITVIVLVLIGIVIIAILIATRTTTISLPLGQTACTQEAKLCPDGSYVGRTGPQCQFSLCPTENTATTTGVTTPPITTTSGISGIVLLGPTCPVMRNPPDPQCADKPYSGTFVVTTSDGSRIITQFNSDSQGKFKVNVPAGEYEIRSASTTTFYPRCSSNGIVSVKAGTFTDTTVSCDTGIR